MLPALNQLSDGLNLRGLLNLMRRSSDVFEKFFVIGSQDLKCDEFVDTIEGIFSESGSNAFNKEQELFQSFIDFCEYVNYDGKY